MNTISALDLYEKAGLPSAFLKRMHRNMLEHGSHTYGKPPRVLDLFRAEDTPEGEKFWLYVQLDFDRLCKFKGNSEHAIEYLLEQDRQGKVMDIGVWAKDPFASPMVGGIDFTEAVNGALYFTAAADMAKALIRQGEIFHKPKPFVLSVALAPESHTADLFTSVPEAEQPKPHVGDSGVRAHSCGELYPHVIVYKGKLENLQKYIIIAGREFACPDMSNDELKKWADEVADGINSGTIKDMDTSEVCKPALVEHFKRQGYDKPLAELIVMRHREQRGYYALLHSQSVQSAFAWADTPEGSTFWRDVHKGKISKLAAQGNNLPIDPRVMAVLFVLQYKQTGEYKREALVKSDGTLYVQPTSLGGVDLCEYGLTDLYFMIWHAPSESLMQASTEEFLEKAYKALDL